MAARHGISWVVLWLLVTLPAHALDVSVVGLTNGKAIITVNGGRPKTLSAGDVGPEGVKLISATSESAVLEIEGKRRTVGMGQGITTNFENKGRSKVVLTADGTGHYLTSGSINGGQVQFLVDTGATMVSLGTSDARRLGIEYLKGQRGSSSTANGIATVYHVKLDSVRVGSITLRNVDGVVHENSDMPFALLGMSFLGRLELKHEGQTLTMMQRF
jgi:aspartyl protease family protein